MNTTELSELFTAVRSGDMSAFEKIYNDLKTPVYTIIVRIMRDRELSEDIMQEVFVKLYRCPPTENVSNLRAYIFKIARNSAIDGMRKINSDASLDELEDTDITCYSGQDLPLKLDVESALRTLSSDECQIITLHVNSGFKFREIAELMSVPLGTVLWKYNRAIVKLRSILGGTL